MYHVVIPTVISAALGNCGLSREALIVVLERLRDQLENHADRYRGRRIPEDPDLFAYAMILFDGSYWHTFHFAVDDRQAQGHLFVVEVNHQPGKTFP